ncbi:4-hydroxythreonine-4-phosphate dehydrogenase PdxA [Alicyclobacillus cycloheptanicus]|uniref:4-hydroxythreonine-4-phosphate dehydrogenase n=1 Tax=Alicyclobacillus cycloheptanicus TaxID=1457 RepID=A0ABT9XHY3_9BACL|nr:4-hydroxythreonine-4-phosphate dehydrogenase PdxA [Alicyclobacillus cycloheptanicus]MDQ0189929.1 4-hydroxythreonine-4-phosphate dehydrogenase [Alicyclobacillus cycloheptanicus]
MTERPILALTIGDPAGIGPEISLKSLAEPFAYAEARPFLVGSAKVLELAQQQSGTHLKFNIVNELSQCKFEFGTVDILDIDNIDMAALQMGVVQAQCGQAAFEYIRMAVDLANQHKIDAIVTAPINKEALKAAHVPYIGHTEMIADLQHAESVMTMFLIEKVKIFFLTRHVPLIEACRQCGDKDFVLAGIRRAYRALQSFHADSPKLAVAGLNPHSGEGGLLGREEIEAIRPAVQEAAADGLNVVGPVPADSVFHFARKGQYDAVLSLYHDQGHIASKMMDFERTVSITIGLPTLRTSVDHGTAFDIAGKGIASAVSMVEAVRAAITYAGVYQPV